MTADQLEELKELHAGICNLIVVEFCEKHDFEFDFWVDVGHIFLASDFFIDFIDAKYDLFSEQPKGQFLKYYDDCIEFSDVSLNYVSYCKGLRHKELSEMKKKRK